MKKSILPQQNRPFPFFVILFFPWTNLLRPAHLIPVFYIRRTPAELRLHHAHRIEPCSCLKSRFYISVMPSNLPCDFFHLPVNFNTGLIGNAIPVDCTNRKAHLIYFRHAPEKQAVGHIFVCALHSRARCG